MKTQTEFYLANQVDGTLTDAQTMQMLTLPEGDSTSVQSGEPEPAATVNDPVEVAKEVDPAPIEAQPVILAKDGIHTIPFEKLAEARESEKLARAQLAELQEQLAALKSAPAPEQASTPQASPESLDVADLFGDFSEESIAKGVDKLVAAKTAAIEARLAQLAAVLEPIQSKQVESVTDAHFNAINSRHPDVESVVLSQEFANWVSKQPSVARPAIQAAIEQGSATEVIEVLDAYKLASGKTAIAPAKVDATAAAQAAIAKAQSAPPMSLSEIPSGSNAAVDEVSAMREMSSTGLMNKFEGKSPEQIMALMNLII